MSTSYVTVTDQFCGAGGSSLGASTAGAEVKLALNHWKLAIETHNSNFPNTDHDCTDISACDPRRYPSTDILITSPECTNHSLAKGKTRKWQQQIDMFGKLQLDPAEERSRATMWDVCRFAEAHRYKVVIVENVVEARHWAPFEAWLHAMHLLGYEHQIVYLNSMFAHPTPQSRDRMYVVFWQKKLRRPNLAITPRAYCERCSGDVAAVQSWKKPLKAWGKYKQQYVYRCPVCASEVTPYYYAAANAIDWSLPAPRIGDRDRPLKEKTLQRIKIGLEKYGRQAVLVDYVHTARNGRHQDMVWTTNDRPHRTMLGIHTQALVTPPFLVQTAHPSAEREVKQYPVTDAAPTQTARAEMGVVMPPVLVNLEHGGAAGVVRSVTDPHPTQTSAQGTGLVVPPAMLVNFVQSGSDSSRAQPVDGPWPTQVGNVHHAIVTAPYMVDMRGENAPKDTSEPLSTVVASGNHHSLVVPPSFLTSYYGTDQGSPIGDAVPTVTTVDRHALVTAPFIVSYYTRLSGQQAAVSSLDESMPTVPGRAVHYLAAPGETPAVEDCGFRMLQPHEIQAAMAFPADYKVLGTQREKVKQLGNAVTSPVMELLIRRVLEVLG